MSDENHSSEDHKNKYPATSKALARLRDLVTGNGIDPDKIKIVGSDEREHTVRASLHFSPEWEVAEITDKQANQGVVKKLRSMSEVTALKNAAWPNRWLDQARNEIASLPGKGWGLDNKRISLSAYTTLFGVDEPCKNCSGRGTVTCSWCHGRGHITCTTCHGAGKNPQNSHQDCHECHGRHEIVCPHCRNGQSSCTVCHQTGIGTRYFSQKFYIDTSFKLTDTSDLPSELIRCIDRAGIAKLANGHAHVSEAGRSPEMKQTELPFHAVLPFAIATFDINGTRQRALVLGLKAAVLEMKPFLDPVIEQHHKDGKLNELRLFADIQKLAAQGKKAEMVLHHYPVGMSKNAAQTTWMEARKSLYVATRQHRWIALGVLSLISCYIIYGWFDLGWHFYLSYVPLIPAIVWDVLLPVVLFGLTAAGAGLIERYRLCKVFGIKSARSQFWRKDLLPVGMAIAGFFILYLLIGANPPSWYTSMALQSQIAERERLQDPPNPQ